MTNKELLDKVYDLLENKDVNALKKLLNKSDILVVLETIKDLSSKELVTVYRLLNKEKALFVFENLDTSFQIKLVQSFTEDQSNKLIEELDPDDRVRLLDELPAKVVKRMLSSLSNEERQMTTLLMGYESQTAGRVMTPEYIRINRKMTVKEALDKVKILANEIDSIYKLYITDDNRKFEGVISLRKLLISNESQIIEKIMDANPSKVYTDTDQEDAVAILQDLDLLALPVVDKQGLLVGVITVDDAMDILEEEATDDILNKAGLANIKSLENTRSEVLVNGSFLDIWKVRLPFLAIALFGGLAAALVMEGFEDALYSVVALAFFIPVVMDMGGSVGTQSSTVFSRGFLLGHIRMKRYGKHLLKEGLVGLSIGVFSGIAAGAIVWLLHDYRIALAVGISVAAVCTFASIVGFVVPYILFKLNVDQGAGKDPIITTIKDISGIFIYFSVASLILGNLGDASEAYEVIASYLI